MNDLLERLDRIEASQAQTIALIISNGQKKALTLDEAASYTGLSKSYLYKLTSSGDIPFYKPRLKLNYFDKDELDNWLLQRRQKTKDEIEAEAATYVTLNSPSRRKGKV